jgi:hypothetical protein
MRSDGTQAAMPAQIRRIALLDTLQETYDFYGLILLGGYSFKQANIPIN